MKILICSQYFWPEIFQINEIAAALSERGHGVIVLTGKPNYPTGRFFLGYHGAGTSQEFFGSIKIFRIPILARGSGAIRLAMNYLSFVVSGYLFAKRSLRGEDFDIVFVFAPSPIFQALPALSVARKAKVPLVLWVQDLWPEVLESTGLVRNKKILKVIEWIVRYIYKRADLLLAQSEAFKAKIAGQVPQSSKVIYFPNSDRLPKPCGKGSSAAQSLAAAMKDCFSVTYTGNLGGAQSLETIIHAAIVLREYEDITFFLVGTGSRFDWLNEQISNHRLSNVVVAGHHPKEHMPIFAQASAALLLTLTQSAVGSATIPSKLQSYLAMGKPIVASADGEAAQVIMKSKSGIVCPADDGAALASAILNLRALSLRERETLGANGRAYFKENFDLNSAVTRLIDILEDVKLQYEKFHQ